MHFSPARFRFKYLNSKAWLIPHFFGKRRITSPSPEKKMKNGTKIGNLLKPELSFRFFSIIFHWLKGLSKGPTKNLWKPKNCQKMVECRKPKQQKKPRQRTGRGYFFIGKIKKYGSSINRFPKIKKGNPFYQIFLKII